MSRLCRFACVIALALCAAIASDGLTASARAEPPILTPHGRGPAVRTRAYLRDVQVVIEDLQNFWATEYTGLYGLPYTRIPKDHIIAARPGKTVRCGDRTIEYAEIRGYAFLCPDARLIYDDANLFPRVYKNFGALALGLVLAHEWGHYIQQQAGPAGWVDLHIYSELQADCFTGAWVAHAADPGNQVSIDPGEVGYFAEPFFEYRDDPAKTTPSDPEANGIGFERLNAFRDGFDNAQRCVSYTDNPPALIDAPGSEQHKPPFNEVVSTTVDLLNAFFVKHAGDTYKPLKVQQVVFDPKDLDPSCVNAVCFDEKSLKFDRTLLRDVYDKGGDFGAVAWLGESWARHVLALQGLPYRGVTGELLGSCYFGGFAAALYHGDLSDVHEVSLVQPSRGGVDEMSFIIIAQIGGARSRNTRSLDRFTAFRDGFLHGYEWCSPNRYTTN